MQVRSVEMAKTSSDLEVETVESASSQKSNLLANRLSNILSASYADIEIGEVLRVVENTDIKYGTTDRRHLRLEITKGVIECNATIVDDFRQVAEVRGRRNLLGRG